MTKEWIILNTDFKPREAPFWGKPTKHHGDAKKIKKVRKGKTNR